MALGVANAPRRRRIEPSQPRRRSISFPGLWTWWQGVLDALARRDPPAPCHAAIRTTSDRIERIIEAQRITAADLSDRTRQVRGWLAFFADSENFGLYLTGLRRAAPIFDAACAGSRGFPPPSRARFVPMRGLYRLRVTRGGTTVALPTSMCAFSDRLMHQLAGFAFGKKRNRQAIIEATFGDEYQAVQAEIESLGGVVEETAGVQRDLEDVFRRVNQVYFGGSMDRPKLTWSTVLTRRKFGHYDLIRDTIMISRTLDDADVPEFVVDFVMYHELLHKKLGVRWQGGRLMAHTAEFRIEEKRFRGFAEAEATLRRLAQRADPPRAIRPRPIAPLGQRSHTG